MPYTDAENRLIEKVREFAQLLASGEEITFDQAMNTIKDWYCPNSLVRNLTFNMVDGYLQDRFGEYWLDTRCPWIPVD